MSKTFASVMKVSLQCQSLAMSLSCSACKLTVCKIWQNRNLPTWSFSDVKHWTVFFTECFSTAVSRDIRIPNGYAGRCQNGNCSSSQPGWQISDFRSADTLKSFHVQDLVAPSTMSWGRLVIGCFWTIILRGQRVTSNWPHHSYGLDVGMSAVETPALFTLYHCFAPH